VKLLRVEDLWKIYPTGVVANRGVTLEMRSGEVLALLGENGAGKTTLVSIVAGYQRPTRGAMYVNGARYEPRSPRDAMNAGIVMVPQHPRLVESFTVYENIGLALRSTGRKLGRREVRKLVTDIASRYGITLEPEAPVASLSMGEKQRVELVKALALNPWLLLLDEPSTHYSPTEVEWLVKLCRSLAAEGRGVVYITHRIREALAVADRIAVMRDGRVVGVVEAGEASIDLLLELMFGEKVDPEKLKVRSQASPGDRVVLEVDDLWVRGVHGDWAVRGVSFSVYEGEIVGIAGIAGNGQRELFEALVGLRRPERGSIRVLGVDVTSQSAYVRVKLGAAIVPEERLGWGLVPRRSIVYNTALGMRHRLLLLSRRGFMDWRMARRLAESVVRYMEVDARSVDEPVDALSGGNMQRLMVGREIARRPRLLLAMNPTSGLDAIAAERVRGELVKLASKGTAILLISEDLDELLEVSNRVLVMSRGRVVAEFERPFDPREVAAAMTV
jgi:simple sugar transport system ATP-binding protein